MPEDNNNNSQAIADPNTPLDAGALGLPTAMKSVADLVAAHKDFENKVRNPQAPTRYETPKLDGVDNDELKPLYKAGRAAGIGQGQFSKFVTALREQEVAIAENERAGLMKALTEKHKDEDGIKKYQERLRTATGNKELNIEDFNTAQHDAFAKLLDGLSEDKIKGPSTGGEKPKEGSFAEGMSFDVDGVKVGFDLGDAKTYKDGMTKLDEFRSTKVKVNVNGEEKEVIAAEHPLTRDRFKSVMNSALLQVTKLPHDGSTFQVRS